MRLLRECSGQATVEALAALPVMIAVAMVTVNALTFLSECAAFDRVARDVARVYAASPSYGQNSDQSCSLMENALASAFPAENLSIRVYSEGRSPGYIAYVSVLGFTPTLFGRPFAGEVFGVSMPSIEHSTRLVIDPYKPGAIV